MKLITILLVYTAPPPSPPSYGHDFTSCLCYLGNFKPIFRLDIEVSLASIMNSFI